MCRGWGWGGCHRKFGNLSKATQQHKPCDLRPGSFLLPVTKKHTLQSTLRSKGLQCGKYSRFEGKRMDQKQSLPKTEDGAWFPATSGEDLRPGDHSVKKKSLLIAICLRTEMQVFGQNLSCTCSSFGPRHTHASVTFACERARHPGGGAELGEHALVFEILPPHTQRGR